MDAIRSIFAYRLHIVLLTFLLVAAGYRAAGSMDARSWAISCAFAALMAGIYLLNKTTDRREDAINTAAGPIDDRAVPFTRWVAISLFLVPLFAVMSSPPTLVVYAATAVLGVAYSVPFRSPFGRFRLKQLLGIKTLTSALIWALPPGTIHAIVFGAVTWLDVLRFGLIFCIGAAMELLWDVRDVAGDTASGVHTIPAQLGVFAAKILAGFCLVAALACGYVLRLNPFSAAAILVSMLFVIFANGSRGAWYYHAIVLVWIIPLLLVLA